MLSKWQFVNIFILTYLINISYSINLVIYWIALVYNIAHNAYKVVQIKIIILILLLIKHIATKVKFYISEFIKNKNFIDNSCPGTNPYNDLG